ncbi:cytochrome P450 [Streptomyces sp. S.PNR 29]|uniref:cytochrome P450 n=1 Tax=Streptomyces sp. S.PNR 29 TaxID=2973805 RepID=UPI0025AEF634|nr:cytochrome P450 [Streptomyces sp. S.PNR 29]MDN0199514.1 cytochrome P450 [Streptomyces sp. S.PNR 29]
MTGVQEHEEAGLSYPLSAPTPLDPPVEWPDLRQKCPVTRVTLASGDEATLLTRYDDVRFALTDPRLSREGAMEADAARVSDGDSSIFTSPMARTLNAEGHERWRRMLGKWFTAKRMRALRPGIESTAERLIDEMEAHGQPADLVRHLAFPLPVFVICAMLGVPESDRDAFKRWSDTFLSMTRYTPEEVRAAYRDFAGYMAGLIAEKRAAVAAGTVVEGEEDLLTLLITATDAEGRPMSDDALTATGQALLIAGHETTAGFITMMAAHLLADRRRWEQLLADRSLIRPAVEEVLRYDPNTAGLGMIRYVHEDVEIAGTVVPSGTTVVCGMAAANRDGSAFERPDEMDLARTPNPHLTFGAGPHSCLGQPLARTEMQAVLDVLLRRLPGLALAVGTEELRQVEGLLTRPVRQLPVRW